jgi:N-acetylglucosaminyldiphosphoundecaprenol N-acetyl-beta-D-mannosaminyltransferase
MPGGLPTVSILGVRMANATHEEAIALMEAWIRKREGRSHAVYIANAHTLNLACEDVAYRAVLNAADVVFGDGTGVRWAARRKGVRMKANLVGTDLLPAFFRSTRSAGYRHFLLGGAGGTASRAAALIERNYPGIRIAGCHDGYFDARDTDRVIRTINDAAPDVLMVAMGNPLQEQWIHAQRSVLRVPVSVGVGGLFDHWAGNLKRAPGWVRRFGIEWAQLLLQQPHKWRRYVLGNPKFVVRALRDVRQARMAGSS